MNVTLGNMECAMGTYGGDRSTGLQSGIRKGFREETGLIIKSED